MDSTTPGNSRTRQELAAWLDQRGVIWAGAHPDGKRPHTTRPAGERASWDVHHVDGHLDEGRRLWVAGELAHLYVLPGSINAGTCGAAVADLDRERVRVDLEWLRSTVCRKPILSFMKPDGSGKAHVWCAMNAHPGNGRIHRDGEHIGEWRGRTDAERVGAGVRLYEGELEALVGALESGVGHPVTKAALARTAALRGSQGGKQCDMDLGARRGTKEGDRNQGLLDRVIAAAVNDASPEPAVRSACHDAIKSGLDREETERTAKNGAAIGEKIRAENAERRRAGAPEWCEPEILSAKPWMPESLPLAELGLVQAVKERYPTDSRMLAEAFVVKGAVGNHLQVKGDRPIWYSWVDGHGWVKDEQHAKLVSCLQRFGETNFWSKDKDGEFEQNGIKGGNQTLAKQAATVLPAYKGMAVSPADLDRHPCLLGMPECLVYDLAAGAMREQTPEDLLVLSCGTVPAPVKGSIFERVILHMLPHDATRDAFQRLLGAYLWGVPMLRAILVMPGKTGAGKSTLLKIFTRSLGGYATTMPGETLTTRATAGIRFNIEAANAMLRGRRIAFMSELAKKRKLDPGRVNEVTGGDELVSRTKNEGLPTSTPNTCSLALALNDLPGIDVESSPDAAEALFQRLRVVRLSKPLGPDLGMEAQKILRDKRELGAALQWLLDGAATFRAEGEAPLSPAMRTDAEDWWNDLQWGDNPWGS